jgi:HAD superfamily hydrolase (TIGR01509 family)
LPGARAALAELRRRRIPVALASSSKNAREILRQTQIDSCFDVIVDGNAITRTKPDPEIFLRAAAGLGLPAGACVVFEDAEAGVTAARRAGCRVVGIGGRAPRATLPAVPGSQPRASGYAAGPRNAAHAAAK